ncbi:MAG: IPT/TIG domain-containing protein, partial [Planctomycetota bacterium]
MVRHLAGVFVSIALGFAASASLAQDHTLLLGQKAAGQIEEAEEVDEIHFGVRSGDVISFKVKARKGETLLPVITALLDPGGDNRSGEAVIKPSKKGNLVNLKNFAVDETGTWILRLSGGESSTGIYDLQSKVKPSSISLGDGEIVTPGQEVEHTFSADVDSEVQIQVKVQKGEKLLRPFMARLERPDDKGDVNLASGARKTAKKKDQVKKLILNDNGTYTLVVTGAENSTGLYTVLLKPGKKVALDFSQDPPDGGGGGGDPAPSVSAVSPTSIEIPSDGSSNEEMTVFGSGYQSGADITFSGDGISNIVTTFVSSTGLTVTFDLASTATVGSRNVTVTNPDEQSGTRNSAFTLTAPPSGIDITSVTPATGTGEGGTQVLIQGVLFDPDATVTFGGVPAIGVNVVDSNSILCTVPPAATLDPSDPTPVDVVVTNPPSDPATLSDGFEYDPSPEQPEISSTVPADGATAIARNIDHVVVILTKRPASSTLISTNFDFFRSSGSGTNDVNSPRVSSVAQGDDPRMLVITRNSSPSSLSTSS